MKKPKLPRNFPLRMPKDLRKDVDEVAAVEHRFVNAQILVFIEEGVARWKARKAEGDARHT